MADLSKVSSRARLRARREPHWQKIRKGCYLGFRRAGTVTEGQWQARFYDPASGRQQYRSLGSFDELPESDRFDAAAAAASKWFAHLDAGGVNSTMGIREICAKYVQHVEDTKGRIAAREGMHKSAKAELMR